MKQLLRAGKRRLCTYLGLTEEEKSRRFWMEKKCMGLPHPKFYIVRRSDEKIGLFSYFITNLGGIRKAVEMGYTPVIDMMTYPNTYLKSQDVNTLNAWEFFFQQPCSYGLKDIKFHKKIINSGAADFSYPGAMLEYGSEEFRIWKSYADQYIRLSQAAEEAIEKMYRQLFPAEKRVLGILCRGTDYTTLCPHGHPVQPSAEMMMEKAAMFLQQWDCEYIFLASEDPEICAKFQAVFGDKVIFQTADNIQYAQKGFVSDYLPDSTSERIQKGMAYLVSIGLLTKCNAFLAGRTSGTLGAMLLPNHYENVYLWDLGLYP